MSKNEPKKSGEDNQKNKKESPQWSEESPADILIHKELAHEDKDPVYPLDSGKDERSKEQNSGNRGLGKSHDKKRKI